MPKWARFKGTVKEGVNAFESLSKSMKKMSGIKKVPKHEAADLMKNFKSGYQSLDEALKSMPISETKHGFLKLGEHFPSTIRKMLREGDLKGITKASKSTVKATAEEADAFKRMVKNTPEKALREVFDQAELYKKSKPYLNSTVSNTKKLSKRAVDVIDKVEKGLVKTLKSGTVIALTLGSLYVGTECILKSLKARKGCFMLTTINNKTTSCKVTAYSCVGEGGELCNNNSITTYYNVTLTLMQIATLPNSDPTKMDVAIVAGVDVSELYDKLATVIDNKYEAVAKIIEDMNNRPVIKDICRLTHPDIESGITPSCRLCDPTANPISTTYIDSNQYADNITFECCINPSISDVLADVSTKLGKDVIGGILGPMSSFFKPIIIVGVVILILVLLISITIQFGPKIRSHISDNTQKN